MPKNVLASPPRPSPNSLLPRLSLRIPWIFSARSKMSRNNRRQSRPAAVPYRPSYSPSVADRQGPVTVRQGFMNSVTSGIGSGIGFGIGHNLFGGSSSSSTTSSQPVVVQSQPSSQQPTPVNACDEMKNRLFRIKESVMYRDDEERYDRLYEEYLKLCKN